MTGGKALINAGSVAGLMRGQAAVELFLVATLAMLTLLWLGNYMNEWQRGAVATVTLQEKVLAADIARIANRASASQVNVTYELPCLRSGSQTIAYTVTASGNSLIVSTALPNATATAALAYAATGSLVVSCEDNSLNRGTTACVHQQGGGTRLDSGACTT